MGKSTISPFLIGKPSINGPFPMAMLVYQRVNGYTNLKSLATNLPSAQPSWESSPYEYHHFSDVAVRSL